VTRRGKNIPKQLEECLSLLPGSPGSRGRLFSLLCAALLKEMGFEEIYIRSGTESGRDIDAMFQGRLWCFECKLSEDAVDTPTTAYKLLQIDMMPERLKPAFFVVISNASTKSILRDIAAYRNVEQSIIYFVDFWTNEIVEHRFDRILLSHPETYVSFLQTNLSAAMVEPLVDDFQKRSATFLSTNSMFFDSFSSTLGAARRRPAERTVDEGGSFALAEMERHGATLVDMMMGRLLAVSLRPISRLYDFSNNKLVDQLQQQLDGWDMMLVERTIDYLEFRELGVSTKIFHHGGIEIVFSALELSPTTIPDWITGIRENCLRMRNFCKSALLPVPATMKLVYGRETNRTTDRHSLEGLVNWLQRQPVNQPVLGQQQKFRSTVFQSDPITFVEPPQSADAVGRPLFNSLMRNARVSDDFVGSVRQRMVDVFRKGEEVDQAHLAVTLRYATSLGWLAYGDMRPYSTFERTLGKPRTRLPLWKAPE
jgi:hypothetical protein